MAEDPTDIFDTSLSSLFSIPPIAFSTSSPDAPYIYTTPSGRPIELKLPHPPPNLYTKLQANNLWLAGIFLADMIDSSEIQIPSSSTNASVKEYRVCELGAGAGLPGVVAGSKGCTVVSSDWGVDEVLDVIKGNFKRAKIEHFNVVGHEWGTDPRLLLDSCRSNHQGDGDGGGKFDALLLADTLWVTEAHSALLDSVFALLKTGGTAHIAAGLHTGRGPVERFVSSARARGATVKAVKEVRWNCGQWEMYEAPERLEEERGVVVYYTCTI